MLIGLCGKPQSGKSEVRFILEQRGFEVVNPKLPIIRACSELTGINMSKFMTQEGKASLYKGVPLRTIIGKVGESMEALFGDYHTIEIALEDYDLSRNLVVDSLRMTQPLYFPGTVVEVVSNNSIETGNSFDFYDDSRISYKLINNGTIGDLEKNINQMLDYLGVRV